MNEPEITQSLKERFWDKVEVKSSDECWEWQAAKNEYGYGIIGLGGRDKGNGRAHRISLMIEGCSINDKQVNHTCHNPECVNPNHLYAGTQEENVQDAIESGRKSVGENHPTAKLSSSDVDRIRRRDKNGEKHSEIAEDYPVNRRHITRIANNKRRTKHD